MKILLWSLLGMVSVNAFAGETIEKTFARCQNHETGTVFSVLYVRGPGYLDQFYGELANLPFDGEFHPVIRVALAQTPGVKCLQEGISSQFVSDGAKQNITLTIFNLDSSLPYGYPGTLTITKKSNSKVKKIELACLYHIVNE